MKFSTEYDIGDYVKTNEGIFKVHKIAVSIREGNKHYPLFRQATVYETAKHGNIQEHDIICKVEIKELT